MVKKLMIILSLLLFGGAAYAYNYWLRLTQIPEWYDERKNLSINQEIDIKDISALIAAQTQINEKIQQQLEDSTSESNNGLDIKLDEQEINQLLITNLAENNNHRKILEAANSIKTNIQDDTVQIGSVITPSQIPTESLNSNQQKILERVFNIFPQLKNQDVYIGVKGQPKAQNGRLIFDSNTKIKIGNITLGINELSQRIGLSPQTIREQLEVEINQLNILDVNLNGNEVMLRVAN